MGYCCSEAATANDLVYWVQNFPQALIFKVITAVLLNTRVFWDVMPCQLVRSYWRCESRSTFVCRVKQSDAVWNVNIYWRFEKP